MTLEANAPPDVSVITVCLNSEATIATTIRSVLAQSHVREYVIVDGGSTDKTLDVIHTFDDPRIRLSSGRDRGIYDAMNKGVRTATGDIIAILNSDDRYSDGTVLADVTHAFAASGADIVYSDIVMVDDSGAAARYWRAGEYGRWKWYVGWQPPHPGVFVRSRVYAQSGYYDHSYRISADYKFLLAAGLSRKYTFHYLPRTTVRMGVGGASTRSLKAVYRGQLESNKAWAASANFPHPLLTPLKLAYKLNAHRRGRTA